MRVKPDGYRAHCKDGGTSARDRGVCASCGAHVRCTIGLATVAGCCSVCGGVGIKPVGSPARRLRYQRGAAPNISPSRPATA
jgi:hypothetical protein